MTAKSDEPLDLRAHLLDVEPPDAQRLAQLQQEVRNVFTKELTRGKKAVWIASLTFSVVSAAFGTYVLLHLNVPPAIGSQRVLQAVWGLYTFSNVVMLAYAAGVLRRGRFDFRHQGRLDRYSFVVTTVIALLLIIQSLMHPSLWMLGWALFGLLWVIVAAAGRLSNRIITSELATREAMLRLELRLVEAAERPGR